MLRLHFTLAILELAVLEVPTGGCVVQPRVLAETSELGRALSLSWTAVRSSVRLPHRARREHLQAHEHRFPEEPVFEDLEMICPRTGFELLNALISQLNDMGSLFQD